MEVIAYIAADDDTDAIELAAALAGAYDAGEPVNVLDATGAPEEMWTVDVDMGDGGAPRPCTPIHSLQDLLREDENYAGVRAVVEDDTVTSLLGKAASIDAVSAIDIPRAWGPYPREAESFPMVRPSRTRPGRQWAGTASGPGVDVPRGGGTGWSPQSAGLWTMSANVGWTANGTGSRRIRFRYDDPDGGTYCSQPFTLTSPAPASVTVSAFTQTRPLEAGAIVSVEVYQASGADLDRGLAENWGEFSMFRLVSRQIVPPRNMQDSGIS